ncbi:sirohydrochlorin chelatase [Chloroflexus aggregans]|uniref:Cobalamin (Vitamin B12) biosynthesis CbiX protein n=1 Tax=Chloroflexus aggregans (strain MD-66 / DSM 9485) TaxID=326427 RepID=B8G800_CHLAD|nr:sirohydrochlorin chelatase [Chloroflexus aggregans]ACL24179.1 cobalamin (vitamin B12) biosynthesis CbiX protein [Chloroflexus aggregans DSM 9485]
MNDTALLLIGHGTDDAAGIAEYHQLAALVQERFGLFVQPCFLELADPSIGQAIDACARAGYQRIVALPLLLGAAGHQKNDIPVALREARARWPELTIHYGAPLGVQYSLLKALGDRLAEAEAAAPPVPRAETALALIGRGSSDPDSNADVARMARLLWEGRGYARVMYGFYSITTPRVPETIDACIALGARRVIVIPYLLFTGRILQRIEQQVIAARQRYPDHDLVLTGHLGLHEGVIAAIEQRFHEAVQGQVTVNCDVCKYRRLFPGFTADFGRPQTSDHEHGLRGETPTNRLETILPPRYRGGRAVSAAPMTAAPLVYDETGQVAWDRVWGGDDPNNPFCELALAGGPPHRGTLLEPVDPATVHADPEGYARVITELARALTMVTDLPVKTDTAPGWIGLVCESEEMAIWLLRAIIVENVSVRRENRVLLLPAGPQFRLEAEIKNVVTAVAKTYHYWKEHIRQ